MLMRFAIVLSMVGLHWLPGLLENLGHRQAVAWLLGEDGIYETIGAVSCLGASVIFGSLFFANRHRTRYRLLAGRNPFLGILALGMFGIFGEELNWGQRVVGEPPPGWVYQFNTGGETAFHVFHPLLPVLSAILLILSSLILLSVIPFVAWIWTRFRHYLLELQFPIAPAYVGWSMLLLAFTGHGSMISEVDHLASEQLEMPLQLLYLVFAIEVLRATPVPSAAPRLRSRTLAVSSVTMAFALLFLGWNGLQTNRVPATYEFAWAQHYLGRGEQQRAAIHLKQTIELDPGHFGALAILAQLLKQESPDCAFRLMERAVDAAPHYTGLAMLLEEMKQSDRR